MDEDGFSKRDIARQVSQIMDQAAQQDAERSRGKAINYDACELMAAITEDTVPIETLDDNKLRLLIDTYGVDQVTETLVDVYGRENFVFFLEMPSPEEPRH
jgi:hypothetical protein